MHLEPQALERKQAVTLYAIACVQDSFEKAHIIVHVIPRLPPLIFLCKLLAGCSYFNE